NVAEALRDKRLRQDGCGSSTVTCDIIGALGDFFYELGADFFVWVFQIDLTSDRYTIVGDSRSAPLFFWYDVTATRAQGDLDSLGEGIQTCFEAAACFFVKCNGLSHVLHGPFGTSRFRTCTTVPATANQCT